MKPVLAGLLHDGRVGFRANLFQHAARHVYTGMKKWNEDAIRAGMSPGQRRDHEEREKVYDDNDDDVSWHLKL